MKWNTVCLNWPPQSELSDPLWIYVCLPQLSKCLNNIHAMCKKSMCQAHSKRPLPSHSFTSWRGRSALLCLLQLTLWVVLSQRLRIWLSIMLWCWYPNTVQLRCQIITGFYSTEMLWGHSRSTSGMRTANYSSLGHTGGLNNCTERPRWSALSLKPAALWPEMIVTTA